MQTGPGLSSFKINLYYDSNCLYSLQTHRHRDVKSTETHTTCLWGLRPSCRQRLTSAPLHHSPPSWCPTDDLSRIISSCQWVVIDLVPGNTSSVYRTTGLHGMPRAAFLRSCDLCVIKCSRPSFCPACFLSSATDGALSSTQLFLSLCTELT